MPDPIERDAPNCGRCDGRGTVWTDLRSLGLGPGATALLAAGCRARHGDDGSVRHEMVCPRCGGEREESDHDD